MKIAVSIFTYNRPWHTKKVLDGIRNNIDMPDVLYIFQDGYNSIEDINDWKEVGNIISSIDWCNCKCFISDSHKGLANTIIEGINMMLEENDAVIVLEDDCVPHPLFLRYMVDSLNYYNSNKKVYSINGYSGFDNIDVNISDTYFTGRASSWGWGTWRDRWNEYDRDYKILNRIKSNKELFEWFSIWGEDLENHLYGNIDGRCDSWAVFWALKVIEKKGACISPSKSLINNIGTDGSGRHGVVSDNTNPILRSLDDISRIELAEEIVYRKDVERAAKKAFSWTSNSRRLDYYNSFLYNYSLVLQKGDSLRHRIEEMGLDSVYIWGSGKYFDILEKDVGKKNVIKGIIESNPVAREYKGYKIINASEIENNATVIVIPGYDLEKIKMNVSEKSIRLIGINDLLGE